MLNFEKIDCPIAFMKKLELLIPPPLCTLICGVLIWSLSKWAVFTEVQFPSLRLMAWVLGIIGIGFSAAGVISFKKHATTLNPRRPETSAHLVTSGVFKISRNPMYFGLLLLLTGWSLFLNSILGLIGVAVFVSYMTRFQIIPEERKLTSKFGKKYQSYKRMTRRWI